MSTYGYRHHVLGGTGARVDLGDPRQIPAPAVADVYVKLGEVERLISATAQQRDNIDDQIRDRLNGAPEQLGERLWAGESIDDDESGIAADVETLRAERAKLQIRVEGYIDAARIGHIALQKTLDDSADALAKALIAKARALPAKLAAAVEIIEKVAESHDGALGLAHMLEDRAAGSQTLVTSHIVQGPRVALGLAAQHLREAIAQMTHETEVVSDVLSVPQPRKGRKLAAEPVETPTTPQAAPAAPSAPESIAFEIGEDDDDA